jgi:hypothetical protein
MITNLAKYQNKWVATDLDGKKIIAVAKDPKILSEKLEKMKIGKQEAIMRWVAPTDGWLSL